MWGGVVIAVDGAPVLKKRQVVGFQLSTDWWVHVGTAERHQVVFRKTRALLTAGFRPQTVTAFVDGVEVAQRTEGLSS